MVHHGITRNTPPIGRWASQLRLTMELDSELVHLRGRRGHTSAARAEVGINRNRAADSQDTAKTVTVVSDAVTHGKHLVRRDRVAGGIEGTSGQSAPWRG
jgi:hypothetical protein